MDGAHLEAWRAFLGAHAHVIRALEQELLDETDLPLSWYNVLAQLFHSSEGRLRMQQLAESLVITRGGFTRLCDRMQQAGLIRREPSQTDRRGIYIVLTKAGRAKLNDARPVYLKEIREHFARHFSERQAAQLERLLSKLS